MHVYIKEKYVIFIYKIFIFIQYKWYTSINIYMHKMFFKCIHICVCIYIYIYIYIYIINIHSTHTYSM